MIAGLKPYLVMRNSGVPWLGKVPEHWDVRRLKTLCSMRSGDGITGMSIEPSGEYPVYGGNGVRGYTSRYTHDGNYVLIGRQGALCGNVHLARGRFWASEHAVVASVRSGNVHAWFRAILMVMNLNQYSLAAAQPGLAVERILNLCLPVPPSEEQAAIARFIDHTDRRIRRYIRAKQKLIKLLEEQKQAIIHRAVTRGLDPNARLKPSGVEWLEEVPEHWEVAALRHRYSQCLGKMLDSKRITGTHSLPYLRNTDVQWDRINVLGLPVMDIAPAEYDRYTVKTGDLLVCEGGDVGRCALWSGQLEVCGFQKALHRLRPQSAVQDVPRFLYYALRTATKGAAFDDGHQSTIAHLTGDKLRAQRFAFPPFDEQAAVVDYLDQSVEILNESVAAASAEIALLREYRTRLIADVVTGELDVREAAANLTDGGDEESDVDEMTDESDELVEDSDETDDAADEENAE